MHTILTADDVTEQTIRTVLTEFWELIEGGHYEDLIDGAGIGGDEVVRYVDHFTGGYINRWINGEEEDYTSPKGWEVVTQKDVLNLFKLSGKVHRVLYPHIEVPLRFPDQDRFESNAERAELDSEAARLRALLDADEGPSADESAKS